MDPLADRARDWSSALVADPQALAAEILHPLRVDQIVGPAFIGYGAKETLDLTLAGKARELTVADDQAVAELRASCLGEEWDHGGSDHHAVPSFGCVGASGDVLAMSGYKTWGGEIAHIAIVSAPGHRKRGLASAAVACAAQHALQAGLIPQYRTLASNAPSIAIAKKLGFERYGFSVYVRLHTD